MGKKKDRVGGQVDNIVRNWEFFDEDFGEVQFTIEAENSEEAHQKAYDEYGPQVDDLYCGEVRKA